LRLAGKALEVVNHTLTPYAVRVFCIVYSARFQRAKLWLKVTLLIPPAATAAVYMVATELIDFFLMLLLWAAPYYGASCWLLVDSFVRERTPWKRRERLSVAVLVVPTLVAIA